MPNDRRSDHYLGMGRPIARRDILQGAIVGVVSATVGAPVGRADDLHDVSQGQPGYYPPRLTGLRNGWARPGLPPPAISSDADNRVIRFRSRTDASQRGHRGKAIDYSAPDYSPVPDLSKYERTESDDDYRHRMVVNAIALVFVSLLGLAGFWLVNAIAHGLTDQMIGNRPAFEIVLMKNIMP